jgi:hypothetical protein
MTWADTFKAISDGHTDASFGSDFGLGVIDLIPPKKPPPVPSDPQPPTLDAGFDWKNPLAGVGNPFAATPGATPEEQKQKDKALLVKVALGGAALLALIAITSGPKPTVPLATAPTPRPGNINIRLDRFTQFGRRKKK